MALREKVWIDHKVQGALIERIVLYWTIGLLYLGLGSACFQYYQHPDWSFAAHARLFISQCGPWIPCLVLILPLVIFDVVRLSNLFTGPIFRLRRHLYALNENPKCRPLTFREDDYWQDLVEPVNTLHSTILQLREQIADMQVAAETAVADRGSEISDGHQPVSVSAQSILENKKQSTTRSAVIAK